MNKAGWHEQSQDRCDLQSTSPRGQPLHKPLFLVADRHHWIATGPSGVHGVAE